MSKILILCLQVASLAARMFSRRTRRSVDREGKWESTLPIFYGQRGLFDEAPDQRNVEQKDKPGTEERGGL